MSSTNLSTLILEPPVISEDSCAIKATTPEITGVAMLVPDQLAQLLSGPDETAVPGAFIRIRPLGGDLLEPPQNPSVTAPVAFTLIEVAPTVMTLRSAPG